MAAFAGLSSSVVFMRQVCPKERPLRGPFLISNYQTRQAIAPHLRTNSRHSAEHHQAPVGWRHRNAGCGPTDHRETRDRVFSFLMPFPLFFLIKHIQPPASDQIQTIAEKTFKPGLGSPISQCHRELFGWYNNCLLFPVFQKFNPSYRQAL